MKIVHEALGTIARKTRTAWNAAREGRLWQAARNRFRVHLDPSRVRRLALELDRRRQLGSRRSFCFLPHVPWLMCGFQRYQQLARGLAECGCHVTYLDPCWNGPSTGDQQRRRQRRIGLVEVDAGVQLVYCPTGYYGELFAQFRPEVVVAQWPDQEPYLDWDAPSRLVYEIVDHHSIVSSRDGRFEAAHRRLLDAADVVAASADDLYREVREVREDAILLPNAVRIEDWEMPASPPVPEDLRPARRAAVVVGYYGFVAAWFDEELWMNAAAGRPDWSFVVIGAALDERGRQIIERFRSAPNIHYLGMKPYEELKQYSAHFDVATIPFLLNPVTHACSPVKLFEFMAAGKPIVTTAMREVMKYRSVRVADGTEEYLRKLEEAAALRHEPALAAELRREAQANTWKSRAQSLCRALDDAASRSPETARRLRGLAGATP